MKAVEGWKEISIGEFVDLINGFAFPSEGFTEGEGKPLIRIRDLERQKTEVNFRGKYNDRYLVKKEDLLIGMDGDFQTVKWKGSDALLNQRVCKLITKSPKVLVQDFLFYRIIEEILHIHRITAATTVKHLSSKDVLGIKIDLPSKPEQTKIAEVLSTVDRAIEQTEALIAKQQRIKTGLMQDLLTRGIDEKGNLRSEQTHEFKDSPLGRIPVEWEVCKLRDLCLLQRGHDLPVQTRKETGSIPVYGSNGVDGYHDKSITKGPGVITGRSGTIGKVHYEEDNYWPLNTTLYVIDFKHNYQRYVYYFLQTIDLKKYAAATGVPSLNRNFIHPLTIIKPSFKEQKRIAAILDSASIVLDREQINLTKLCSLKTALMQDLLTGKKRVTALLNDMEVT